MENELAKLRIAHEIHFSENEIKAWLKSFCSGDPDDPEFRRNIIDTFINSVYLYDDRIVLFYNIKGGKQISYVDLEHEMEQGESLSCSDLSANGVPKPSVTGWLFCIHIEWVSPIMMQYF